MGVDKNTYEALLIHAGSIRCPICGDGRSDLLQDHYGVFKLSEEHEFIEDGAIPIVVFMCKRCGYLMQFSSKTLGV